MSLGEEPITPHRNPLVTFRELQYAPALQNPKAALNNLGPPELFPLTVAAGSDTVANHGSAFQP